MLSSNSNNNGTRHEIPKEERWKSFYIIGTIYKKFKVTRDISAEELREKFENYRQPPVKAFREALSFMHKCPYATLIINNDDDFSKYRFEKKSEHVYINHFKRDAEFWI